MIRFKDIALMLLTAAGLAACGSGNDSGQEETGFLSLGVSDSPIHSAKKVCITFDDVELKLVGEDEPPFLVDLPETKVNLLAFQGMNAAPLLFNEEVPAGEYEWMRLVIDASLGSNGGLGDDVTDLDNCTGNASYIVMDDDTVHNIWVPSGDQTGLKLSGFTVPINGTADFTAEWDLMRSMVAPPGLAPDVILKPTIKLVNNAEVGTLTGDVSAALTGADGCEPSVFVFDAGIAPNPDDGTDDAVATGMVDAANNRYEIGFLQAGSYVAAFTCDSMSFVPEAGEDVTIDAGEIVELDFE